MGKIATLLSALFFGIFACNSTSNSSSAPGLDHTQAKALVTQALKLPVPYEHYIKPIKGICWGNDVRQLQKDGLITYTDDPNDSRKFYITVTEAGRKGYIGEYADDGYVFKIYDIAFNAITGVAVNQTTQTATVRFSLKAINITAYARSIVKLKSMACSGIPYIRFRLDEPINGEMTFKKFDTGWQVEGEMVNKSQGQRMEIIIHQNGGY